MSFKLNNIRNEDYKRIAEIANSSSQIEYIHAAATLNPHIPTTQLTANSSSYSVILPNAEPGDFGSNFFLLHNLFSVANK